MGVIIGLTGGFCAGKGVVLDYLASKGFISFSLSDAIRKEMTKQHIEITRTNLLLTANKMREKEGPGVLGKRAKEFIETIKEFQNKNIVIDSIRNPYEVKELRKLPNFHLLLVTAPVKIRYNRAIQRNREQEHTSSLEEFIASENKEKDDSNPAGLQLHRVADMADYSLDNPYDTPEQLFEKIDKLITTNLINQHSQ